MRRPPPAGNGHGRAAHGPCHGHPLADHGPIILGHSRALPDHGPCIHSPSSIRPGFSAWWLFLLHQMLYELCRWVFVCCLHTIIPCAGWKTERVQFVHTFSGWNMEQIPGGVQVDWSTQVRKVVFVNGQNMRYVEQLEASITTIVRVDFHRERLRHRQNTKGESADYSWGRQSVLNFVPPMHLPPKSKQKTCPGNPRPFLEIASVFPLHAAG